MTVNQLHKILGKLIENGNGRTHVAVNKPSFTDNRESDGCVILPVGGVDVQYVVQASDDGGTMHNQDGTERLRRTAVIHGLSYEYK